jgi:SWI/SNF-related matrix-associated actin-dependent regulator 1 of chromatin subfamily A
MAFIMRGVGISALLIATPSLAQSKIDRARTAVAEATAKVDAAEKIGAGTYASEPMTRAQESLRVARDQLARDHRDSAISEARRASALAEEALVTAERNKTEQASAERDARLNAEAQVATEASQRAAAQDAAASAEARAAQAQQAATTAAASAEAAAARAAAAETAATTTVTTVDQTTAPARSYSSAKKKKTTTVRKTTRKAAPAPAATTTTTTTVETKNN